jgi:hypothetical protein
MEIDRFAVWRASQERIRADQGNPSDRRRNHLFAHWAGIGWKSWNKHVFSATGLRRAATRQTICRWDRTGQVASRRILTKFLNLRLRSANGPAQTNDQVTTNVRSRKGG